MFSGRRAPSETSGGRSASSLPWPQLSACGLQRKHGAGDYPAAVRSWFNVGLLHSACAREARGSNAYAYAPCTVEQLVNHGYDYWALGHVHGHALLSEAPHIVYSGNLQGRDPRETGAKGAVLVTVEDGMVASVEHRPLDVVRWATVTLDAASKVDRGEMIDAPREQISDSLR